MNKYKIKSLNQHNLKDLFSIIKKNIIETKPINKFLYKQKFWHWQYSKEQTKKKNLVIVAAVKNKIIGYLHAPIFISSLNKKYFLAATIQDVAVDKDFRGRGILLNLCRVAEKKLALLGVDYIYTLPNSRSIGVFKKLKYNLNKKVVLNLYFRFFQKKHNKKKFIIKTKLSRKFSKDFALINTKQNIIQIKKNFKYLKWRYEECPKSKYYFAYLKSLKNFEAGGIFTIKKFFFINLILLSEFSYKNKNYGKEFLKNLLSIKTTGINLCIYPNLMKIRFKGIFSTIIPHIFIRRKIKVLYKFFNKEIKRKESHFSLGDWDMF